MTDEPKTEQDPVDEALEKYAVFTVTAAHAAREAGASVASIVGAMFATMWKLMHDEHQAQQLERMREAFERERQKHAEALWSRPDPDRTEPHEAREDLAERRFGDDAARP